MSKSLIQQAHNISYVLTANETDFNKVGNSFLFTRATSTILVVASIKDDKYCIEIEKYDRDVFTSDDPDDTFQYTHHKTIGADYFSFMLNKFLTK